MQAVSLFRIFEQHPEVSRGAWAEFPVAESVEARDAVRETIRDGAPPIGLKDGDQRADKLKELRLGVRTEMRVVRLGAARWDFRH
jgi:hypothetical protein